MTCEACGTENPPSAKRCDCGHTLGTLEDRPKRTRTVDIGVNPMHIVTVITRVIFVLPLAGAAYGGMYLFQNWDVQKSAPQQAALAGYVLACTVIPYCFARAFAGISGKR